jgi:nitronate monooxygenase
LNRSETEILPYPLQRELVRNLTIAAEAAGRADLVPMWAGQSANLSTCTDVSDFLTSLVEDVSEIAGPIMQWSAARREKQIRRKTDS